MYKRINILFFEHMLKSFAPPTEVDDHHNQKVKSGSTH
jgi:hypothetical protein